MSRVQRAAAVLPRPRVAQSRAVRQASPMVAGAVSDDLTALMRKAHMIRARPLQIALGVGTGIALAGGGYALAASTSNQIHACANTKTHVLVLEAKCPRGSRAVVWSVRGPAGSAGRAGTDGKNGSNGTSATLNSGVNVTEVNPSTPASASITQGSGGRDTLNLSIPQGATGSTGVPGRAPDRMPMARSGLGLRPRSWRLGRGLVFSRSRGVRVARRSKCPAARQLRRLSQSSPSRRTTTAPTN